ncbi:FAD-dependent oxidoreductase [Mesorhizobium australicum]|uniref:FAD-dependent oxidoreductase n=1 Tax=Mesorhizobium australicum TaxID=536018 RepID=UPI003EC08D3C
MSRPVRLGGSGISYDIAIAGAGPAGLAAALYVKRAGHRVTIFERFEEPRPVGSGLILPRLLAAMVAGTVIDPFTPAGLAEARWPDRLAE